MIVEKIRVSKAARDQMITLKRRTGVESWFLLCRWGFCLSLAEPTPPRDIDITTDSSVEMTWRTFAGENDEVLPALLRQRCEEQEIATDPATLAHYFRLHLHRGIAYLAGDPSLKNIEDMLRLIDRARPGG